MSEQSGPITREQVERAIAKPRNIDYRELPLWWREWAPDYVIAAEAADDWDAERAALTRWRDELAAAEPVRRVARWDAERASGIGAYVCTPPYEFVGSPGHQHPIIPSQQRHLLEAAGYEIEGGPEPVRDWKSDRAIAAIWPTPKPAEDSPERAECGRGVPAFVARYAAALSAEEARLAAEGADRVIAAIGRPAPRFKVGDRVTSGLGGPWKIGRVEWGRLVPEADCDEWVYHHASGNVSACESVLALAWTPTPASPPAPKVVDVPQPAPLPKTVAHFYTIRALPEPHRVSWNMPGDGPQWVRVNDALWLHVDDLRAMLADIDAQQGGAS